MSCFAAEEIKYGDGLGNHVATESLPGALPVGCNSPQMCPYGLYAEQLSGCAFTVPRAKNLRSWLYRIQPAVLHSPFVEAPAAFSEQFDNLVTTPNQTRWSPADESTGLGKTFIDSLELICGSGDPCGKDGVCIYNYCFNQSMGKQAMYNSDGDFLIVPNIGTLYIKTELGKLVVEPCEIVVIPRGINFSISTDASGSVCRGYICEIFNGHFQIPDLGPIGANGLANPRDFKTPTAWYEDVEEAFTVVNKYGGKLFTTHLTHSPFNVVAWHGNYYPFKYDLRLFNTMNTVSYDHADPCIFTVLTCPTTEAGVAVCDFVIFPPRWMVAENTFRPPYYHRNVMSEFMGMVWGKYDAKTAAAAGDDGSSKKKGFLPGGSSLHLCMTPHGPDASTFEKASDTSKKQEPVYFGEGLAFMFETTRILKIAPAALQLERRQEAYSECWQKLPKLFNGDINAGKK